MSYGCSLIGVLRSLRRSAPLAARSLAHARGGALKARIARSPALYRSLDTIQAVRGAWSAALKPARRHQNRPRFSRASALRCLRPLISRDKDAARTGPSMAGGHLAARLRWAVRTGRWNPSEAEWQFLLALLPPEERQQCTRFRFPDDQRRALVSRLLARRAAGVSLGLPPGAVVTKRTRGGKPYVSNDLPGKARGPAPNWNFSVSHEGEYVILASEPACVCGCDVSAPRWARRRAPDSLDDFFRSFERQFLPSEWARIRGAGDEEQQEAEFRRFWSLKESFVKATGEGLGFDLNKVEFALDGDTATVKVCGVPQPEWAFHLHELGGGHAVAVARAPLAAVVDAWGGFKATFQKTAFAEGEWQEQLSAPEPPFQLLSVADLVPEQQRDAYVAAGGELY